MKRQIIAVLFAALSCSAAAYAQTTITGTAVTYGTGFNTRMRSSSFTLRIRGETSDAETKRLLRVLQDGGQDKLLDELQKNDLGSFSLGGGIGRRVNAVRIERVGDRTRVRAVLARWLGFGELRGGYRSLDYPFSYIELMIDPRTGRGDGTFFAAAKIRFHNNDVEIEDFGILPGRLMRAQVRGVPLP